MSEAAFILGGFAIQLLALTFLGVVIILQARALAELRRRNQSDAAVLIFRTTDLREVVNRAVLEIRHELKR